MSLTLKHLQEQTMKIKLADISEGRLSPEQSEALQKYFESGGTWQDLLKLETDDVEEVYAIGHGHYADGDYEKALAAFSALIQLNPYAAKHWIAIGATLQAQEMYSDAMAAYELSLTLDEERIAPLFYCAQCAYALGEKEHCSGFLKQVIEKNDEGFSEKARLILEEMAREQ